MRTAEIFCATYCYNAAYLQRNLRAHHAIFMHSIHGPRQQVSYHAQTANTYYCNGAYLQRHLRAGVVAQGRYV